MSERKIDERLLGGNQRLPLALPEPVPARFVAAKERDTPSFLPACRSYSAVSARWINPGQCRAMVESAAPHVAVA